MSSPRKLWASHSPRSPCGERQSNTSEVSTAEFSTLSIPIAPFTPTSANPPEEDETWDDEADEDRKRFTLKSRALFHGEAVEDTPPSSPAISDTLSEDDDSDSPVPLYHPHPKHPSPILPPQTNSLIEDYTAPATFPEEVPSASPRKGISRSPSLVPTIIASRSPSPKPHPCVAQAQALGIEVRDFAFEDHGVTLARPVPDLDQLKARYLLYRTAGLTPPPEVLGKLRDLDQEWLVDNAKDFDDQATNNAKPGSSVLAWRRETKKWLGIKDDEPVSMDRIASEESCEVGEMTAELEAVAMKDDVHDIPGATKDDIY